MENKKNKKMKKILFISTRDPYSGRYSGDVIRSLKIINVLKKKFQLDVIYLGNKKNSKNKNIIAFENPNYLLKICYCIMSALKLEPIQFGLFFSKEMRGYINNNAQNYDFLFFYHIRSSQYLPKIYAGKSIIEMGDLYSDNYYQTFKYLNFFNPMKYVYFLESLFVKKIENKIFSNFDKIILFSKNEIYKLSKNLRNKVTHINESVEVINNKFTFSQKNFRILFVGNLNYLPNILACKNFCKNTLPKLKNIYPKIKFSIIGDIKKIDKFLFLNNTNVEILGPQKKITKFIKNSICGLANLEIATGVQGKILTYMSYGLPVICSKKSALNFQNNILSYKNNSNLLKKIIELKTNREKSKKFSKKSITYIKKLNWNVVQLKYLKLLKS